MNEENGKYKGFDKIGRKRLPSYFVSSTESHTFVRLWSRDKLPL